MGRLIRWGCFGALVFVVLSASIACAQGSGASQGNVTPTKKEIEELSDRETLLLLRCQSEKVRKDLGTAEGKRYISRELNKLLRDKNSDSFLQYELARDGYYCTANERSEFASEQRKAEQEALYGPPRELEQADPGVFGGAFVGDVNYKIDKKTTGEWMMTARVRELEVTTTAGSEAEIFELAKTLKEKYSGGVDIVRAEYFAGKKDLDQRTYDANGTICIIRSKDGLTFFGDQYPMGPAYEQAKQDFKNEDGIVFLGSTE